jgi:hypothetical protein
MTKPKSSSSGKIDIPLPHADQVLGEILNELYGTKEAGEARALLEASGAAPVWNEDEFQAEFATEHVDPPYINVVRRSDGVPGTVLFVDKPRFYFSFIGSNGVTPDGKAEDANPGTSL